MHRASRRTFLGALAATPALALPAVAATYFPSIAGRSAERDHTAIAVSAADRARRIPSSDVTLMNASVQHQIDYLAFAGVPEDHPSVDDISADIANIEAMMIACVARTPHGMAAKVDVLLRRLGYRDGATMDDARDEGDAILFSLADDLRRASACHLAGCGDY